jgi:hypothetical protein
MIATMVLLSGLLIESAGPPIDCNAIHRNTVEEGKVLALAMSYSRLTTFILTRSDIQPDLHAVETLQDEQLIACVAPSEASFIVAARLRVMP